MWLYRAKNVEFFVWASPRTLSVIDTYSIQTYILIFICILWKLMIEGERKNYEKKSLKNNKKKLTTIKKTPQQMFVMLFSMFLTNLQQMLLFKS